MTPTDAYPVRSRFNINSEHRCILFPNMRCRRNKKISFEYSRIRSNRLTHNIRCKCYFALYQIVRDPKPIQTHINATYAINFYIKVIIEFGYRIVDLIQSLRYNSTAYFPSRIFVLSISTHLYFVHLLWCGIVSLEPKCKGHIIKITKCIET